MRRTGPLRHGHPALRSPGSRAQGAPHPGGGDDRADVGPWAARAPAGPFRPGLGGAGLPAAGPGGESAPLAGTPAYLQQAYDLTALAATAGSGDTVAIVDAFWDSEAESDLRTYRRTFELPACEKANGCFTQVNENGGTTPSSRLCREDAQAEREECEGWLVETSLDMDAVSAICPKCSIVLVEGRNAERGLIEAESEAYKLAPNQISDSWSGPDKLEMAAKNPGVATVAASGDLAQWAVPHTSNSAAAFPAGEDAVTAVGGTDLLTPKVTSSPATRGFQETVWFERKTNGKVVGTGSGCTSEAGPGSSEPEPSWQHQTVCPSRSANDVSADADPATGLLVYEKAAGGGLAVGGTSLATPMTAAYYALLGHAAGDGSGEWNYTNAALLNDVLSGSNGSCGSLICTAGPGYDGPTGNGSISGDAVAGAPGVAAPSQVSGGYITTVQSSGVSLSGGIYPNQEETSYWWEYGTSVAYGSKTAETPVGTGAGAAAGSGGLIAVNSVINEGLAPETTYHYRLVARNPSGVTYGYDFTFNSGAIPPNIGSAAVVVGTTSATVTGEINPEGEEATYGVEFGASEAYTASSSTQKLAAGTTPQSVTVKLEGLQGGQTYHFRFFAESGAGRTVSKDQTFTTEKPPPTEPPPTEPVHTPPTQEPAGTPPTQVQAPPNGGGTGTPAAGTGTTGATETTARAQGGKPAAPALSAASQLARLVSVKASGPTLVVTARRPAGGGATIAVLLQLTRHGKALKTVRLTLPAGASKTVKLKLTPALVALRGRAKAFTVQVVLREALVGKHGRAGKILARRTVSVR